MCNVSLLLRLFSKHAMREKCEFYWHKKSHTSIEIWSKKSAYKILKKNRQGMWLNTSTYMQQQHPNVEYKQKNCVSKSELKRL